MVCAVVISIITRSNFTEFEKKNENTSFDIISINWLKMENKPK